MTDQKTHFNGDWLADPKYKDWLQSVPGDLFKARCRICCVTMDLSNMGKGALRSHSEGKKHCAKVSLKVQTQGALDFFCTPAKKPKVSESVLEGVSSIAEELCIPTPPAPTASGPSTTLSSFISNDTVLEAEIMWCLKTVMSHYSQNSCTDSGKLFQRMFPDSAIAQKFECGKTKNGYLIRFGLAQHFFSELMKKIHTGDPVYVISFDESMCRILQKEQMDLHIRFWDSERKKVI